MTNFSGSNIVERFWPYDGPADAELVGEAVDAASELVRYLNNKTRNMAALPSASDVDRVTAGLSFAMGRLDQLLGQLAVRAEALAAEPGLYDDRTDRHGDDTARSAAAAFTRARRAAVQLADALGEAHELTAHLGGPVARASGGGGESR